MGVVRRQPVGGGVLGAKGHGKQPAQNEPLVIPFRPVARVTVHEEHCSFAVPALDEQGGAVLQTGQYFSITLR